MSAAWCGLHPDSSWQVTPSPIRPEIWELWLVLDSYPGRSAPLIAIKEPEVSIWTWSGFAASWRIKGCHRVGEGGSSLGSPGIAWPMTARTSLERGVVLWAHGLLAVSTDMSTVSSTPRAICSNPGWFRGSRGICQYSLPDGSLMGELRAGLRANLVEPLFYAAQIT